MNRLLIAGGGVAGMSLALASRDSILLSNHSESRQRFFAINAASEKFLSGAINAPLPGNMPVRRFLLCAGTQQHYISAPDDGTLCKIVSEDALLSCLDEALQKQKKVRVMRESVIGCAVHKDRIRVALSNGTHAEGEVLAAADGARSPVAKMLGVGAAVLRFHQLAIVGMLRVDQLANDTAAQWFAKRDVLALLPAGAGVFALVWSLPEERAQTLAAQGMQAVTAAVQTATGLTVEPANDRPPQTFPLFAVRRAARAAPRTAFVGDAARVIHPLAGQGLNAGLADAALLLKCLQHRTIENALADYARSGRFRGLALHTVTSLFNRFGGFAAPAFALAARAPFNRLIAKTANM